MGRYLGIPILFLAAILDTTLMAELRIGGGGPDLVFLLVVAGALMADLREGLLWAVAGGVMADWLSVAPLGSAAVGLVIVVAAANLVFGQVNRRNVIIPPVVALVGLPIYHAGILLGLRWGGYAVPVATGLVYVTLPALIYNGVLILPVFRIVGLVAQSLQPRRARLE